ncbi:type IV pilin protein [Trinickia sp. NRRL B-1857]|uniref:type IV pilin protein n=1 Tax=Trinickia sp. NRRL B-1857 TaxID=3162879 RepID=UPI003D2A2300
MPINRTRASGFSMLELVVALAMVAVLASYAVPSYRAYAARGHRTDAVVALHRAAQYIVARPLSLSTPPRLPPVLERVPAHGKAVYRLELSLEGEASGGYELKAIPQADGPMRGDACGTFVLDGLGIRSNLSPALGGAAVERCWAGRAL